MYFVRIFFVFDNMPVALTWSASYPASPSPLAWPSGPAAHAAARAPREVYKSLILQVSRCACAGL